MGFPGMCNIKVHPPGEQQPGCSAIVTAAAGGADDGADNGTTTDDDGADDGGTDAAGGAAQEPEQQPPAPPSEPDLASLMDVQIAAGTYDVDFYAQWVLEQEEWGACGWSAEQLEFWSEPARRKLVEDNPECWEENWDPDVHGERPSGDLANIAFDWGDCETEYEEVDVTFGCDFGGQIMLPANSETYNQGGGWVSLDMLSRSLDELSEAAGGGDGRRVYDLVCSGRARRFPMTNFDFKSTVLFGSMRTPRATNNPGLTTTATTADAGCILSQLNAQGPHFASKTKRLIADFCGVPYKAAFVEWVAQLECQVNTEAKGKEGNEDVKDEGETVGDDGDRSSSSQQQQQQQQQEDVSWDGPQYTVHTGWKCNSASEAIVVERACSVREFIYMLVDTHPGYESCRCKFQERELVNGLRGVNGI